MTLSPKLAAIGWYAGLSAGLKSAVAAHGRSVTLAAGQTAYLQGDENTGLWLVLSGALRLEMPVGDDRDVLIGVAPTGTMFGRTRAGGAQSRIVSARAVGTTSAFVLSDAAILRIADDDPGMWQAMVGALHGQVDTLLASLSILLLPPPQRVAARLVQMAQSGVAHIRQSDLAELSGLSRKSTNGHVRQLADAGMIVPGYGAIRIVDIRRLKQKAES